jgi:nucleoside-diphosphate-sugar epimerase
LRVVLTGGGGFIGSYVLARMMGAGIDVTLVGPNTGKSRYTASLVAAGDVRFIQCDESFAQEGVLGSALAGVDALVLMGYVMPTASSVPDRLLEEFDRNAEPTVRLLRLAGERVRQVVFASSASVYGAPARVPVRESDALSPTTPYAIAKVACEQAIRVMSEASGLRCAILRFSTVYGPGELVPRAIPNFIRAALAAKMPVIRGDGLDERDYVHVTDVADATLMAVKREAQGVYNVATGIGTTTREIARLVYHLAGSTAAPVFDVSTDVTRAPTQLVCDTEAGRRELGFTARRSLHEGISEEIGWFRSQLGSGRPPAGRRAA